MAKWDTNEVHRNSEAKKEQWEYARFIFNWQQDFMDVGNNKRLRWPEAWDMFNRMGEDGWEMIGITPLSSSAPGHGGGDTNQLLIVLKRCKTMTSKAN